MSTLDSYRTPVEGRAEAIVLEAQRIITERGLEGLTMRMLAGRLGLKLPSLYRVFPAKQDVLDRVAESLLGDALAEIPESIEWGEKLRMLAHSLRNAILNQRDGARILGGAYTASKNTLSLADRLVSVMVEAGFDQLRALWATTTLFCYVLGEALEQQGPWQESSTRLNEVDNPEEFPNLYASPVERLVDFDERFAFGLDAFLHGLTAIR